MHRFGRSLRSGVTTSRPGYGREVRLLSPLRLLAATGLIAAATACGLGTPSTAAPTVTSATAATTSAPAAAHPVDKVIVFMVENHSLAQMQAGMPRTYAFARRHSYATDYSAIQHPSLPNYIAIAAGSTLGISDDADPSAHRLTGNNVFRQARKHHRTARTYADAMPRRCALTNAGTYAVRHNPWTYFTPDRAACRRNDVPATRLARDAAAGALPHLGFVIPDVIHDAHDGTLAQADAWISQQIATLTAGPDWRSGRLAIVVTADEDDHSAGNKVLTVVATKGQHRRVVTTPLDHYSLTGFLEDVIGARHLRHARTAPSLAKAFGIDVG